MACCLWGLFLIIDSRDEMRMPTRNVFLSLIISTLLLSGLGVLSALFLNRYPGPLENPFLPLLSIVNQVRLLGPTLISIIYAILGTSILLAALNRAFVKGLSLANALGADGFLPTRSERISTLRNVPLVVLGLFSALGVLFLLLAPTLTVVKLASITFLWTTALIHAPDLVRSDTGLPQQRRPRLPFHPLFPGLTFAIAALLPFAFLLDIWWIVVAWLILGALYYWSYAYQKGLAVRRSETVVGITAEEETATMADYRVLVAVANPKTAASLIHGAAVLARARGGVLLILSTLQLADQVPLRLRQQRAQDEWQIMSSIIRDLELDDLRVEPMVRLAPSPSEGILSAVDEEKVDLLVLGWEGHLQPGDTRRDPVLNPIMRRAQCNVALVHGDLPSQPTRVLVPSAGSPHAALALELGQELADPDDGVVTLVSMVTEDHPEQQAQQELRETRSEADVVSKNIEERILEVESVQESILTQAKDADLLILGASREGIADRAYFGGIAVDIASLASIPTVVARQQQAFRFRLFLQLWESISDALPTLTPKSQGEIIGDMRAASVPNIDFFVLIVLAAAIAILGLLQNSAAVIIGAMLVAPLMSPIIAMAMNLVLGDLPQLRLAGEATIKGIALAILVGVVISLISPIDEPTAEIMGRTQPNILDLMVALFSGAAAGYAISRKEVAAALPGVAIAAALVPPLTVVGYGLAVARLDIASGSLLLFTTNLIAIILAAAIVFLALGFQPRRAQRGELLRGLQITVVSLLGIGVVLAIATVVTVRQINLEQAVTAVFESQIASKAGHVETLSIVPDKDGFKMDALVLNYAGQTLTSEEIVQLEQQLVQAANGPITLDATTLDAERAVIAIEGLGASRDVQESFRRAVVALSTQPIDIAVRESGTGYTIQSTLIAFDMESLNDDALAEIQQDLSEQFGAPITIRTTILPGRRAELLSNESTTPMP
jgi:uncharacterized hydrophobic protein (TIGR00271 family)